MNKPLISIIVPVYNSEKYLKECLDSIINQTHNNLEIVVINDGSTDNSLQILKTYKDSRIKLINKKNGGVSSARNEGLKQTTGEYIMFVDSDDYLTNNNVVEILINNINGCDVIKFGYTTNKNNNLISDGFIDCLSVSYETGESFLLDVLNKKKDYGWYLWQYVFKRSLWEGVVFPDREILEDLSTIYRILLKANRVNITNTNVYTYRINKSSLVNVASFNKCKDLLYATKEAINQIDSININKELKTLLKNNFSYGYVSEPLLVCYLSKEEKKEINKLLIENRYISNNVLYGKQKLIVKLVNIFGLNFIEYLLSIRNKIKK